MLPQKPIRSASHALRLTATLHCKHLVCLAVSPHAGDGLYDDPKVERKRPIVQIIEIQFDALLHLVDGVRLPTASVDLQKRVEIDLKYINNWSLWLDLKILVKTPFTLLSKDIY